MLYQMAFPDVDIKVCPVHCYNITKENSVFQQYICKELAVRLVIAAI